MDKVQKIREEVERLMYAYNLEADIVSAEDSIGEKVAAGKFDVCKHLLSLIDSQPEEPVSEDLGKAAITAADEDMRGRQIMEESNENRQLYSRIFRRGFKVGAK